MTRLEKILVGAALLGGSSPAFAAVVTVPAPIAGVGIGAVVLIGAGYRLVKRRINS
jgi:hypothetical protein